MRDGPLASFPGAWIALRVAMPTDGAFLWPTFLCRNTLCREGALARHDDHIEPVYFRLSAPQIIGAVAPLARDTTSLACGVTTSSQGQMYQNTLAALPDRVGQDYSKAQLEQPDDAAPQKNVAPVCLVCGVEIGHVL
jgi:hypothetical protein